MKISATEQFPEVTVNDFKHPLVEARGPVIYSNSMIQKLATQG